jgi:fimbrial chaperone protein
MKNLFHKLSFLVLLSITTSLFAAAVQITPIRVNLSPQTPIATLNLVNKASTPIMLETQTAHWTQKGGDDVYEPSQALIVSPPIISLEPGKAQLIRVALRNKNSAKTEEDAFRIFIQEIPKYHPSHTPGVDFALRFGVPAFIAPLDPIKHNLQWQTKRLAKGELQLRLINVSQGHIQLTHIKLLDPKTQKTLLSENIFIYLLPQQSKTWTFKLNTPLSKTLTVNAETDWGSLEAAINL